MYCRKCGAAIPDDSVYCPNCREKLSVDSINANNSQFNSSNENHINNAIGANQNNPLNSLIEKIKKAKTLSVISSITPMIFQFLIVAIPIAIFEYQESNYCITYEEQNRYFAICYIIWILFFVINFFMTKTFKRKTKELSQILNAAQLNRNIIKLDEHFDKMSFSKINFILKAKHIPIISIVLMILYIPQNLASESIIELKDFYEELRLKNNNN